MRSQHNCGFRFTGGGRLHALSLVLLLSLPAVSLADYFGLEVIDRSDLTICKDQTDPDIPFKLSVCEIHVVFDDPADRLISVAFSNVSTTDPAGFYQHTFGGDTAPGCNLLTAIPTLVCDSFVTLAWSATLAAVPPTRTLTARRSTPPAPPAAAGSTSPRPTAKAPPMPTAG